MAVRHALCALALGSASIADADFSWELAGVVGESDRAGEVESRVATISATHYFTAVADGDVPPALAAFLDPTTSVSIATSATEGTDRSDSLDLATEARTYSVGGTYVFPQSRWYTGGHYASGELDDPTLPPSQTVTVQFDADETSYGASVGKYFGSGATRLELSLARSQLDSEQLASFCLVGSGCFSALALAHNTVESERLEVMHVRRFRSATYALTAQISREDAHLDGTFTDFLPTGVIPPLNQTFDIDLYEFDSYSVGTELYPVPAVGVSLSYALVSRAVYDEDTVDLGVSWFFRRKVGFELTLSRVESELLPRTDRAALRVIGRLQ